jgi:ADP-ribosylglycohydrolase
MDQLKSKSLGAIIGACVGDAIGATLEGRRGEPSQMDVAVSLPP